MNETSDLSLRIHPCVNTFVKMPYIDYFLEGNVLYKYTQYTHFLSYEAWKYFTC